MALSELPFQNIRESALRRIRLSEAPAAAMRQQAINVAGLRTSGVGQLPLIEAARNRALSEAGIEESISGQEAQQLGSERLARLQNELAIQRMEKEYGLAALAGKTGARQDFQSELAGLGLGIGAGALKGALLSQYPWLAAGGLAAKSPLLPGYRPTGVR